MSEASNIPPTASDGETDLGIVKPNDKIVFVNTPSKLMKMKAAKLLSIDLVSSLPGRRESTFPVFSRL
jgi:hypothetical protein